MKEEEKLIATFGRKTPFTVPDGYFESVRNEIEASLPAYPEKPKREDMTTWQKLKPYVYLAAMFAGIWCMMKVFHHASGIDRINLDNPPAQIAAYMGDPGLTDMMMIPADMSDLELMNEVSESYDSMEEFEKDFGYELEPEYDNIDL